MTALHSNKLYPALRTQRYYIRVNIKTLTLLQLLHTEVSVIIQVWHQVVVLVHK